MDAFFVSVELLSGRSSAENQWWLAEGRTSAGVVSAASYEARKFGIQSAMPLRTAANCARTRFFLDGHHAK